MRKILIRAGSIVLGLIGCALVLEEWVVTATICWIVAATIWILSSKNSSNDNMDLPKFIVMSENLTSEKIMKELGDIDTPLGRPWLCKMMTIKQPVVVYGPDIKHAFIYGYWFDGHFVVMSSRKCDCLKPGAKDKWRIAQKEQSANSDERTAEVNAELLEQYREFFEAYAEERKTGLTQKTADIVFGEAEPQK